MAKFINSKSAKDYADQLKKLQTKITAQRERLRLMEEEEQMLIRYLCKVNNGREFEFESKGKNWLAKFTRGSRMMLDQAQCKAMLKNRTPYVEVKNKLKIKIVEVD